MITSYEVGSVYRIVDQATPTLLKIATELSRIERLTKAVTAEFAAFGKLNISGINRSLLTLNERLGRIEKAATTTGRALSGDFVKADASINAAAAAAARLTAELNAAKAAGAGLRIPHIRPGGGGGSGPNTPGAGGAGGGHRGNGNWQHVGIGLGMGGMIGLHEVGEGLRSILDAGGERQHVLTAIRKQNATDSEILAAVTASRKLSQQIQGVTETEALEAYGANRGIFGHKDALAMMKPLLEYTQVVGGTTGDYAGASKKVYDMTRAADLMGKLVNPETHEVDTDKFKHFLELGSKVTLGTHGKVDAATWLGLAQQGGPALSGMSDKGLVTMGMVSQIMGGQRGGTALTSMYQQMVGGKMTKSAAEQLRELGLVGDFTVGRGGHVSFAKDALNTEFTKTLKDDPLAAVEVLRKAMANRGITDIEQQVPKLFEILGRQTTQRLVHDLLRNAPQMLGERERILGSKGIDESRNLQNDQDYKQAEHNLSASWKNLMTALGQTGVQTAVDAMNGLAKGINTIAGVANANPTATKIVLEGLAGLGVAFAALSVAGVIAGAAMLIPGGGVALAITGLISVFGTLAAFNWKIIDDVVGKVAPFAAQWEETKTKFYSGVASFVSELGTYASKLADEIKSWPGRLATAIAEMGASLVTAIGDMLKNLFSKLNPFSKTAFEGGEGIGGLIQKASFGGGANDNFGGIGSGLSRDGLGGSGSGLGSGLGGSGGGAGLAHARGVLSRANPEMVAYIRASAIRNGINPDIALRIAASEGLGGSIPGVRMTPGDKGTSFGPYQLHYGGRGSLGTEYSRATGHHAGDPRYWQEQIDFALRYAGKNRTWAPWFGRGPAGVGTHEGFGYKGQAAPTAGAPPKPVEKRPIMVDLHMDGKKMGRAIAMHQADDHLFPKKAGATDNHGEWRAPGTPVMDAA
ncbi:hypothetical protein MKK88_01110 [Methylobacterium sp. E-005]|uniref:hypothetical protein n=1 Tax=Methylobacterium sp. E-005 TaxID=2836549 RepID=UPI001FBBB76D|nr:hypothetical protein [Methylobacterium sp. E-005]MCJ2084595.1 hypothetical protein [Methylobacterium sp. E-005]